MIFRYFYDTEFIEDGNIIDLISIGIVADDGRTYYAANSDLDMAKLIAHPWLNRYILPHLPTTDPEVHPSVKLLQSMFNLETPVVLDPNVTEVKPRWVIANEIRDFLLAPIAKHPDAKIELWADYGAYDHVALCQLWGTMTELPAGIPMWTHDLQQEIERHGADPVAIAELLLPEGHRAHHALDDAWETRWAYEHLQNSKNTSSPGGPND